MIGDSNTPEVYNLEKKLENVHGVHKYNKLQHVL